MERRGAQRVDRKTRAVLRKARHFGRLAALHPLDRFEGKEREGGLPGASNNAGGGALLARRSFSEGGAV